MQYAFGIWIFQIIWRPTSDIYMATWYYCFQWKEIFLTMFIVFSFKHQLLASRWVEMSRCQRHIILSALNSIAFRSFLFDYNLHHTFSFHFMQTRAVALKRIENGWIVNVMNIFIECISFSTKFDEWRNGLCKFFSLAFTNWPKVYKKIWAHL